MSLAKKTVVFHGNLLSYIKNTSCIFLLTVSQKRDSATLTKKLFSFFGFNFCPEIVIFWLKFRPKFFINRFYGLLRPFTPRNDIIGNNG